MGKNLNCYCFGKIASRKRCMLPHLNASTACNHEPLSDIIPLRSISTQFLHGLMLKQWKQGHKTTQFSIITESTENRTCKSQKENLTIKQPLETSKYTCYRVVAFIRNISFSIAPISFFNFVIAPQTWNEHPSDPLICRMCFQDQCSNGWK